MLYVIKQLDLKLTKLCYKSCVLVYSFVSFCSCSCYSISYIKKFVSLIQSRFFYLFDGKFSHIFADTISHFFFCFTAHSAWKLKGLEGFGGIWAILALSPCNIT